MDQCKHNLLKLYLKQALIRFIQGTYLYDRQAKACKLLIKGILSSFDITYDGKIAYIANNSKKISELHVAYLENNTLKYDEIVYTDLSYVTFLEWSQNAKMLFCISDNLNGSSKSSIFRFAFQ